MKERQRVILFGDSLILSGVRASLESYHDIEVVNLDTPLDRLIEALHRLTPATVIFDLGVARPDSLLILVQQPDLQLIGINPDTHQALVLSSQVTNPLTTKDLMKLLQQKDSSFTIIDETGFEPGQT